MPSTATQVVYHPQRISTRVGAVWASAVAVVGIVVDQLSKQWAVSTLVPNDPQPLLGDVLTLRLLFNPGAAFSMATGFTPLLTLLALTAVVGVVAVVFRRCRLRRWAIVSGLVVAGAGGNVLDRLFRNPGFFHGHVVDFLELPNWPVFNVADMCLCTAAGLAILWTLTGSPGLSGVRKVTA